MINPDGSDRDQRRNAAGRDLNRDHIQLTEPETRAMHYVVQRERPHVIVDCHEYGRDAGPYISRGWTRRSDIMMGAMNSPHLSDELVAAAHQWVYEAAGTFDGTDITYCEYYLGGPPPDSEQRFSTMTSNDARNGLGTYGGLSFIIESGRFTNVEDRYFDFGRRVDAYYHLLSYILQRTEDRTMLRNAIYGSRTGTLPPFLPVHYFWGNDGLTIVDDIVRDADSGEDISVSTANFQHNRVVKRTVRRPHAYAIPAQHASLFLPLLEHHAVVYQILDEAWETEVEIGQQNPDHPGFGLNDTTSSSWAVTLHPFKVTLPAGSALVPAAIGTTGRKASLILEPTLVEYLYEFEPYDRLFDSEGSIPVYRIP